MSRSQGRWLDSHLHRSLLKMNLGDTGLRGRRGKPLVFKLPLYTGQASRQWTSLWLIHHLWAENRWHFTTKNIWPRLMVLLAQVAHVWILKYTIVHIYNHIQDYGRIKTIFWVWLVNRFDELIMNSNSLYKGKGKPDVANRGKKDPRTSFVWMSGRYFMEGTQF